MADLETQPVLLILPALSLPPQRSSLSAAYASTLCSVFRKLLNNRIDKNGLQRLDIAVVLKTKISAPKEVSRASQFPSIQLLFEEYYRLACITAAQEQIDLDFPGGVDVRLLILDPTITDESENSIGNQTISGPLIDIHTFANSSRSYRTIYVAECEEGGRAVNAVSSILRLKSKKVPPIERLPCGTSISIISKEMRTEASPDACHYSVAVGGTFDHLHIGHKLLLSATVFLAEPDESPDKRVITVGITGDALLVKKKYASQVESWHDRQTSTAAFVESILVFHPDVASIRTVEHISEPGPNGKVVRVSYGNSLTINYTQISDPFGPTITEEEISALVISKETRSGGKAVNDKRAEKGWKGLEIFEVDVLDAGLADEEEKESAEKQTFESKISSTDIRRRLEERNKAT